MKKLIYIIVAFLFLGLYSCIGEKQKLYQQQLQQKQQGYDSLYSEIENSGTMSIWSSGILDFFFTSVNGKDIWAYFRIDKKGLSVKDICLVINNDYYSFYPAADTNEIFLGFDKDSLIYKSTVSKLLINPMYMYIKKYGTDEKNLRIEFNEDIEKLLHNLNDSNYIIAEIPKGEYRKNITVEYNELLNKNRHLFYFGDSLDIQKLLQVRDYYYKFKELDKLVKPIE